ncbi:MAG: type II secretion system F family protein [Candidatus Thiodiazotropha sp. L084R]
MKFVIPQFEALFSEFGAELPPITQTVIDASAFFSDYWWSLASTLFLLFVTWHYIFPQFRFTRYLKGAMVLNIPVMNSFYRLSIEAQLTSTLGLISTNNVAQLKFLQAAEQLFAISHARDEIIKAKERINTGYSLAEAFSDSDLFTPRFIKILRMFEKRGLKEGLFLRQATRNKQKLSNAPNLNRTLEPVLMMIMGLLIGYLVVAMYLPVFQLGALM